MILHLLDKISHIFSELDIPYMLTGSMAMTVYAENRMTQDIDVVIELQNSDVVRLLPHLTDKYYYSEPSMYEEIKRRGMFNIIHFETGFKADLILCKYGHFDRQAFERKKLVTTFGFPVWVTEVNDLVIAKLRWIQVLESERQKRDITNLLDHPDIDLVYIKQWCNDLNLKAYNLF
ncbi:MAG: hypothetical protein RLZZ292_4023 [Bacteroidota bacterium]|jgi:hypothetical protein